MPCRERKGFTLVDVLVSAVILLIAIYGAIQFRYHAALQIRKADMHISGAELGQMLVETWRGTGGSESFDFVSYFSPVMAINAGTGPAEPGDFNLHGSYAVQWEGFDYLTTLSSKELPDGLRALNVIVTWQMGYSNTDKQISLTSYADLN